MNSNLNSKKNEIKEDKIEQNIIKDNINEIQENVKEEDLNNKIDFINKIMNEKNLLNISKVIEEKISDNIFIPKIDD